MSAIPDSRQATTAHFEPRDVEAPLAAGLSFLLPGLGQAYNRQFWLAGVFLLPIGTLSILGLLAAREGVDMAARLVDVRFLAGLIALDMALLGWRLVAIAQAHAARGYRGLSHWTTWLTGLLLVATLAMHTLPGWYAGTAISTLNAIARGGSTGSADDFHDVFRPPAGASVEPTPLPTPGRLNSRLTVLLVGIDYIPSRASTFLTDTMIVATIDPRTGIDLISVPRDTFGTPLGDGRIYNAKLNGLWARARREPANYPLGGPDSLKAAVGELTGLEIDYVAAVQVLGFKHAIDALGGIDITVERSVSDPTYIDEFDRHTGFYITPGQYHMDGHTAVAYARSRKGIGDNDFTRAARQQQILVALFEKLTAQNLITSLPRLLEITGDSVASDVPVELLPEIATALQAARGSGIDRLVLQPPLLRSDTLTDGTYILVPDIDAIQQTIRALLTMDGGLTLQPDA